MWYGCFSLAKHAWVMSVAATPHPHPQSGSLADKLRPRNAGPLARSDLEGCAWQTSAGVGNLPAHIIHGERTLFWHRHLCRPGTGTGHREQRFRTVSRHICPLSFKDEVPAAGHAAPPTPRDSLDPSPHLSPAAARREKACAQPSHKTVIDLPHARIFNCPHSIRPDSLRLHLLHHSHQHSLSRRPRLPRCLFRRSRDER